MGLLENIKKNIEYNSTYYTLFEALKT